MAHGTAMFISSVPVSSDHWKKRRKKKNRSVFFLKNKLFFSCHIGFTVDGSNPQLSFIWWETFTTGYYTSTNHHKYNRSVQRRSFLRVLRIVVQHKVQAQSPKLTDRKCYVWISRSVLKKILSRISFSRTWKTRAWVFSSLRHNVKVKEYI